MSRALLAVGTVALAVAVWGTLTGPSTETLLAAVGISLALALVVGLLLFAAGLVVGARDVETCGWCGWVVGVDHYDADADEWVCPHVDPAPVERWECTERVGAVERDAAASARAGEVGRGWRR